MCFLGTCVAGQNCKFEGLLGDHLAAGDNVVLLDTCGQWPYVTGFPAAGEITTSTQSGQAVSWGNVTEDRLRGMLLLQCVALLKWILGPKEM